MSIAEAADRSPINGERSRGGSEIEYWGITRVSLLTAFSIFIQGIEVDLDEEGSICPSQPVLLHEKNPIAPISVPIPRVFPEYRQSRALHSMTQQTTQFHEQFSRRLGIAQK